MQNFFEKKKCYVSIHNVIMHIKEVGKYVFACMNISLMEKYWNRVNVPEKFLKKMVLKYILAVNGMECNFPSL